MKKRVEYQVQEHDGMRWSDYRQPTTLKQAKHWAYYNEYPSRIIKRTITEQVLKGGK